MVSVVIVEDHQLLAEALANHLEGQAGIELVATCATLRAATAEIARSHPNIALLDHRLSDGDSVVSTRAIREASPETAVVLMSAAEPGIVLAQALDEGIAGFVHKSRSVDVVVAAIRAVAEGGTAFDPDDLRAAVEQMTRLRTVEELSPRELEVLHLLARGWSSTRIADHLMLSHHTARNHVRHVLQKLDAHTQLEAVASAIRLGLVELPRA